MSVPTQCPSCSRRFAAPDNLLGKSVKCPQCTKPFVVQAAPAAAPAAISASRPTAPEPAADPAPEAEQAGRRLPLKHILIGVAALLFTGVFLIAGYAALAFVFSGGGGWKEYASKDGGFTVLMPGSPEPKSAAKGNLVTSGAVQEIQAPAGSSSYSVHYYDLPYKLNDHLVLTSLKHQLLIEKSGKLARERELTLDKHAGSEVVVDLPDGQTLQRRHYVANARVFWLTALYPQAAVPPPEAERFFESFKITTLPPAPPDTAAVAVVNPPPAGKTEPPATKTEPPVTKKDPPPPVAKAGFPISADEQSMLEAINLIRAQEKVAPLNPDKKLFDGARLEANAARSKKPVAQNSYGYRNTFRLTLPGRNATPRQILDAVLASKVFRGQLVSEEFTDVGVGVSKDKDGTVYYMLLFGGA